MKPMRAMKRLLQLLLLIVACLPGTAVAHSASTAYLRVASDEGSAWTFEWRVALRDLDALLDLDSDRDGRLTWGEVTDRARDIEALAARSLLVRNGAGACEVRFGPPRYARGDDLAFAQIAARSACADGAGQIELEYRLFAGLDPTHRALVLAADGAGPRALAPGATITLDAAARSGSTATGSGSAPGFGEFFATGVGHIANGIDHLLFLVALMLPSVVLRSGVANSRATHWTAHWTELRTALIEVGWIVTAFTLAHSLTLAAATFGWVRFPASVIEPLIAVTVLLAALNNLWPVVVRRLRWVAFAFGLVHGFGFAEVLAPLSLPAAELAQALLAFNLGVEAGQLVVVALGFGLLALAARWTGYRRWILSAGSIAVALLAVVWLADRVFDLDALMPAALAMLAG